MVAESVRVTVVTRVTPVRNVPRGSSTILMRRKTSLAKVIIKTLFKGSHSVQKIVAIFERGVINYWLFRQYIFILFILFIL